MNRNKNWILYYGIYIEYIYIYIKWKLNVFKKNKYIEQVFLITTVKRCKEENQTDPRLVEESTLNERAG